MARPETPVRDAFDECQAATSHRGDYRIPSPEGAISSPVGGRRRGRLGIATRSVRLEVESSPTIEKRVGLCVGWLLRLPKIGTPYPEGVNTRRYARRVADPLVEFTEAEYEYLVARSGADFFLALGPYSEALRSRSRLREAVEALEVETRERLDAFVSEQNAAVDEATAIRRELAERAPEIDNSDMEEPDLGSPERMRYDLDSFAGFDRLAASDHAIGYPLLPGRNDDPGPLPRLLGILRGRLRAAEYGEDAEANAEPIRRDLDDLGRRIRNLAETHRASVQRYQQEARTLAGVAFGRLAFFGTDLVAEPAVVQSDDDFARVLDRSLAEWGHPKTIARKLVNGEGLADWEQNSVRSTEATLKAEAERLNRELRRRVEREPRALSRAATYVGRHAARFVLSVSVVVVGALILLYAFGIGR